MMSAIMNTCRLLIMLVFAGFLFYACSKTNSGSGNMPATSDAFKKNMLVNYADTIILPAYARLQAQLGMLEQAANSFLSAPSVNTQAALRAPFKDAYIAYEGVAAANFGPAAALLLNNSLNTFPSAIPKIEAGIQSGNYDFTLPIASDSLQGFPALDYLFFSADAVQQFNSSDAEKRKQYVRDVIARMQTLVTNTVAQWNNGYRDNFVNSLQTNIGSSIGNLINQFAYEVDALKGPRIGYPFGKQSNGIVFADKSEAYYSGISKELAIANLTSLRRYFAGGSGSGIDDYLVLLGKSQLNTEVLSQFDLALAALQAIPGPLPEAFTNSPATVEKAYGEIQKLLTLIKTDVASATAVQITYMDNDGD